MRKLQVSREGKSGPDSCNGFLTSAQPGFWHTFPDNGDLSVGTVAYRAGSGLFYLELPLMESFSKQSSQGTMH